MISVCIPTYNGEKYIAAQLQSILMQLGSEDEVIISDDSSTDKTIEIIESLNDERIKILKGNSFKSPIFNMENALKYANGDIIFLSDQDDVWLPDKVKITTNYMNGKDITLSDCFITDSYLKITNDSTFKIYNSHMGVISNLIKNSYMGCCMAFRKELLILALPFPKDIPMHDIWIGFIGDLFFSTELIKQPLIFHRRHDQNFSSTGNKSQYGLLKKMKFRFNYIKYIPALLIKKWKKHNNGIYFVLSQF